jgi:hypothetical protein
MTLLTNSFEGGTNGTTITTGNSGGASGNAFDVVNNGSGATTAFDSTRAAHGSLSCQIATSATSANSYVQWNTSMGSQAQVWFRLYLYFTANPAANTRIAQFGSGSAGAFLRLTSSGTIAVVNLNGGAVITTTSASIPLGTWFRVEGFVLMSATVGQTELKLFTTAPDAPVPSETDTSAASLNLGAATISGFLFGVATAQANVAAYWQDDLGLSNTGYIGPVQSVPVRLTTPFRREPPRLRPRARLGAAALASGGAAIPVVPLVGPVVPVTVTAVPGSVSGNVSLVQQVSGTSTFDYGLSTTAITTTTGSTLVVLAGWDLSTSATSAPMPAVYVTDSQDNYWYHIDTSTAGVTGSRSAIWYCPNARAISWLSVSLSTFASSLAYTILEIQNLPDDYALDAAADNANVSALSLAVNAGTAAGADVAFTVLAASSATGTVTGPAGWQALTPVTSGAANPNPVTIYPYWAPITGAGSLSVTFSVDAGTALSGVVAAIAANAPAPVQPKPNMPILKVEAAFGYTPGDPSQAPPVWTDISARALAKPGDSYVISAYGRQYELSQPEAGELTITLDNHDGLFTPGNTASPLYPDVVLGTPIRASAYWQGFWYYVGFGYVERWPQQWPDLPQWTVTTVLAADTMAALNAVTLPAALDGDLLLDAPYVLLAADEQYTSYNNGINPTYSSADAQGFVAANESRVNARNGMYVDGTYPVAGQVPPVAIADTGQQTNLLGDNGTGFGTSAITTAPTFPVSGPGIIYTDPSMPDPLSANGVTVEFWVIIPSTVASTSLQPVVFSAYGPSSGYFTANPSLSVLINNAGGGATLTVYLADGSSVTAPFNTSANPQQILLEVTSSSLGIWVNGGLQATASLSASQVTSWNAVTLGCCNYAYQTGTISAGNFTAFDLALYGYQLPLQRAVSHYVTGESGQQNVDATARLAQILSWSGLGFARAGQVLFNGVPDGVMQGPAYDYKGRTAADAASQLAVNHSALLAAAPSGALVFTHRWALFNQSPVVVFGDSPDAGEGEIPYLQVSEFGYDNTYLYNYIQVTQQYGANTTITATVPDFSSQHMYFTRSGLTQTIETMSNLDVFDLANYEIAKYAQPQLRVSQLSIDVATNPQYFGAILSLQQGQVALVVRTPVGGAQISELVLIEKITHSAGPDHWMFECELSPYVPEDAIVQLDATGYDVLGSNTLG